MNLVIDSSVVIKWFVDEPLMEQARDILYDSTAKRSLCSKLYEKVGQICQDWHQIAAKRS